MSLATLSSNPEMRVSSDMTVADAGTTSGALQLHGNLPAALIPTSAGSIAAATASFQASFDGTNYYPVHDRDTNALYSVAIAKDVYEALKAENFFGARFIRIVLSSAQSGASAIIKLITVPY